MNNENVIEWLLLADEDLYAAKLLNEAARKPYEITIETSKEDH